MALGVLVEASWVEELASQTFLKTEPIIPSHVDMPLTPHRLSPQYLHLSTQIQCEYRRFILNVKWGFLEISLASRLPNRAVAMPQ